MVSRILHVGSAQEEEGAQLEELLDELKDQVVMEAAGYTLSEKVLSPLPTRQGPGRPPPGFGSPQPPRGR